MVTRDGEMMLLKRFGMAPPRAVRGRIDAMALYAGQSVGVVSEVKPAADILHGFARSAEDLLRAW